MVNDENIDLETFCERYEAFREKQEKANEMAMLQTQMKRDREAAKKKDEGRVASLQTTIFQAKRKVDLTKM